MPEKYVAKHRGAAPARMRPGARRIVYFSGAAALATGLAVTTGLAAQATGEADSLLSLSAGSVQLTETDLARREASASRSSGDRRARVDEVKAAALSTEAGAAVTKSEDLSVADPRSLARSLMPSYGLSSAEFDCLDSIWSQESGWNVHANNPYSSAYGIPQALPGSKMAAFGDDWRDNAETQIRWGLNYIKQRYGSACSAYSFKKANGWY